MSKSIHFFNLRKNPIVNSIGIYTFSNFFAKGASFLLFFVFTNPLYILPSENGLLSLFSTSMLFLMPFLSMGIIHSTATDFFKLDKEDFRSFFTTGFVMPLLVMLISFIVLFFSKDFLYRTYGFPAMFVWLIPVITFLTFCNEQLLGLARNNNETSVFLKANISKTVLELGLSFLLVVVLSWRWQGRIAGILIAYIAVGGYAMYYFIKKGYFFGKIKKKYIIAELVYAIPIIAMQASIFAMTASDKFFLSNFTNDHNETVGIYSIAGVFASIINVFHMALIQYVFPKIFLVLASPETDNGSIRKNFLFYTAAMALATVLIIIFIPILYHYFIHVKYHSALKYIYLLCISNFLWAVTYYFYSFMLYHKQKKKILGLSFISIAISITCNYFFIKSRGDTGAAIATVTCYFLVLILTLFFTKDFWQKFIFYKNLQTPEA